MATASPSPPLPLAALLPDPSVSDLQAPDDPFMTELLALRPQAKLHLQDAVQITLHPMIALALPEGAASHHPEYCPKRTTTTTSPPPSPLWSRL